MNLDDPLECKLLVGIAGPLARAQAAFADLTKTRTAKVKMKAGGEFSYGYASLSDVLAAIRDAFTAEGIAVTQPLDTIGGETVLRTILLHENGMLASSIPLPMRGDPQQVGSLITYYRRYALLAAVGLAVGDDDDGAAAAHATTKPVRERPVTTVPVDERRAQAGAWADALTDVRAERWADWKHAHTGWHKAEVTFAEAWELLRDLYAVEQAASEVEPFADEHPILTVPSSKQMKRLFAALKTAGIDEADRHEWAAGWLRRPVTTFADLTVDEWEMLVAQADAEGTTG